MNTLILKLLFTIQGVGAASGLIYRDGGLYVISDNSNYLYHYAIEEQELGQVLLLDRSTNVDVPKKHKADFEAVTADGGTLYVFGSGSSKKRDLLRRYDTDTEETVATNMRKVYKTLRKMYSITEDDFNIEGALFVNDELWLFNRGNGPLEQNGVYVLDKDNFSPKAFHAVPLGGLDGVPLGFTDAILVDGKVYFTAAAEGGESSFHDGEVMGTVFGCLDPGTMKVEYTELISEGQKFEGITVFRKTPTEIDFLLCEDPDNGENSSTVYQLTKRLGE